jgi:flavin reductase (DIM6/NTAB) family NADH-FMN oxidoreductase RutF
VLVTGPPDQAAAAEALGFSLAQIADEPGPARVQPCRTRARIRSRAPAESDLVAVPEELRALFGRYPSGVAVVTVDAAGQRLGLTVGTLVSLSLDPPLVGFAVSREAAMHELLREAGGCAVSLLAAGQDWLAQHFARGVPPIAMWHGIATEAGAAGAPLLVGALGWLECALREELAVGTHTLFVCGVERVELGVDAPPLVRARGEYGDA